MNALTRNTTIGGLSAAALVAAGNASAFAGALASEQTEILGYVTATTGLIIAVGFAVLGLVMIAKAVKWGRKAG